MGGSSPGGGSGSGVTADDLMAAQTRQQSDQEDVDLAKQMEERRKKREADAAKYNLGQQLWPTMGEGGDTPTQGFDTTSESAPGPMATKDRKWW